MKRPANRMRATNVWQAHSTQWLDSDQINRAIAAAQTRLLGNNVEDFEARRFVDYRRMSTSSHSQMLDICRNFAALAHGVLGHQGTEHVTATVSAFIAALHCGVASSIVFSDNSHWRCIHFDPVRRKVLCIDPYGNGNPDICLSQDLKAATKDMLGQWCLAWTVEETQLIMQHRSDGHSYGVWTIWLTDEWMQFVQAGLPSPGFEQWLSQKAEIPLSSGQLPKQRERERERENFTSPFSQHWLMRTLPKQDILRTYYGHLITDIGDMDPVATRPLFRPTYFAKLYAYWLAQRGDHGGLCMQALAQGLTIRRTSANEPEDLTIPAAHPRAEAQAKAYVSPQGRCDTAYTCRPPGQSGSMDDRQAKGNAPNAPIAQTIRKRTQKTTCRKMHSNAADGRASCAAQEQRILARQKCAPYAKIKKLPAPSEQMPKKQKRIADCWADSSWSRPMGNATSQLPQKHAEPPYADLKGSSFGLKILCWNVMGLTTVREELEELLRRQDPDIIIMTETKLTEKTQRKCWLNNILKTHWLQFSSCPHSSLSQGERQGSGGIAVAVRKSLVPAGCHTRIPVREDHRSRLLQLQNSYSSIYICRRSH